jgi:hypothetical protein
MNRLRFLIGMLAIAATLLAATPALAAPPSNDTIAGATVITALPFADTRDTTEATLDAAETAAAQPCRDFGAPATDKPVWYKYTASAGVTLQVNTSASDYTTGIAAYSGTPSAATFIACAPAQLVTSVAPGETRYLMIFADTPGSPGGTLRITVQEVPAPPEITLTVDPNASFDSQTGTATVSGTVTCTGVADFGGISGQMSQSVGRFIITGFFNAPITCDGETHAWTAQVTSQNGKFGGGKATVQATAFACNSSGCGQDVVTQEVRLRGKK